MQRKIVILGDIHAHEQRLEAGLGLVSSEQADLVLLAGDIGCDPPWLEPTRRNERARHDASVRSVVQRVRKACRAPVVFVPGNHDLSDPANEIRAINVDGRREQLAGLSLVGLGGAGPAKFGFPYEWTEAEAERRLHESVSGGTVDVLLSHTPPVDTTLDLTSYGAHVGSRAVLSGIERQRPRIFVCGHIHEAWGVEWVHGVPCVNAGSMGEPYGQVIVWCVDWDDGPRSIRSLRRQPGQAVQVREWFPQR